MKAKKLLQLILALSCVCLLAFGSVSAVWAGAEVETTVAGTEEIAAETEPTIVTEPESDPEPVTETDPYTEPYTEPETTVPETTQPQTETAETTEARTEYIADVTEQTTDTTEFVAPTLPKTVSTKNYTTNYAAGIISWLCVLVGIIVIISVAVSTKLSGSRDRSAA